MLTRISSVAENTFTDIPTFAVLLHVCSGKAYYDDVTLSHLLPVRPSSGLKSGITDVRVANFGGYKEYTKLTSCTVIQFDQSVLRRHSEVMKNSHGIHILWAAGKRIFYDKFVGAIPSVNISTYYLVYFVLC